MDFCWCLSTILYFCFIFHPLLLLLLWLLLCAFITLFSMLSISIFCEWNKEPQTHIHYVDRIAWAGGGGRACKARTQSLNRSFVRIPHINRESCKVVVVCVWVCIVCVFLFYSPDNCLGNFAKAKMMKYIEFVCIFESSDYRSRNVWHSKWHAKLLNWMATTTTRSSSKKNWRVWLTKYRNLEMKRYDTIQNNLK